MKNWGPGSHYNLKMERSSWADVASKSPRNPKIITSPALWIELSKFVAMIYLHPKRNRTVIVEMPPPHVPSHPPHTIPPNGKR